VTLLAALRGRAFALLFVGQTISRFGDSVSTIAIAWLVLQLTGSAAAMGIVLAANVLAFLTFSLIGGVVVDRLPRLNVMLASDLLRAGLTAVAALLVAFGAIQLWQVVVFAALYGAVLAFFFPAYQAAVPDLVPPERRPSANSLQQLSRRLAMLVGPAIGAGLVAAGGTAAAFALDAVSFGVSAAFLFAAMSSSSRARPARATEPATGLSATDPVEAAGVPIGPDLDRAAIAVAAPPNRPSAMGELREGLRAVRADPWLWIGIGLAGVTGITLGGPIEAGLPLLVKEQLGGNVGTLGLLEIAIAAGATVTAVVLGSRTRLRRRGLVLYGAWMIFAVATAAAGTPIGVGGVVVAAAVAGACGATVGLVWTNTVQDLVKPELLGRVNSIDAMGSAALEPVGFVVGGASADLIGAGPTFIIGGVASVAILSLAFLSASVRHLD
jgi:MFS family permease